jgi:glycoside/pentoside/hexuronide:cation symporter, GPH family
MADDLPIEGIVPGVETAPPRVAAAAAQPARLPTVTKFLFGVGSVADGSQIRIIGGILLLYYSQVLHLPTAKVSAALGLALFIDAFFDLFVAQVSDNLRTRLGRRHILMYASALPAGISFMLLWMPPAGLSQDQLFLWLMVFILAFRFSHSLYMVPSGALLPELAPDYHDRTVLFGYRYMLGTIGGAIAAVLAYGVFLKKTPAFPLGQLNPAGYPPMAVTVGLMIVATSLISSFGTHSRIKGLYKPPARKVPIMDSLREVASILNNHNFAVAVGAGMLAAVALALVQGLELYFNTFMFHMPSSNIMLIVGTQVLSAPIAFVLAPAAARRWGKRYAYMGLFAASLIFTHGPITLRLLGAFPANGSPLLLPSLMFATTMAGLLQTAALIINTSMIADIVEENQAKTGRRSEGLVLFSDRLLLKVASSLATILPGILLAWIHFPLGAKPATLSPDVMRHLALIYLPLATGLSVLAILSWLLFRIDRDAHDRNLQAIAARKAAAGD